MTETDIVNIMAYADDYAMCAYAGRSAVAAKRSKARVDLWNALREHASAPTDEPVAWISRESLMRLASGGNSSKGTVPVHSKRSVISTTPLYTAPIAARTKEQP